MWWIFYLYFFNRKQCLTFEWFQFVFVNIFTDVVWVCRSVGGTYETYETPLKWQNNTWLTSYNNHKLRFLHEEIYFWNFLKMFQFFAPKKVLKYGPIHKTLAIKVASNFQNIFRKCLYLCCFLTYKIRECILGWPNIINMSGNMLPRLFKEKILLKYLTRFW